MKDTTMKKITLLASLVSASFVSASSAEELVAAWDFNYPESFGGLDVDGDFVTDSSAPATFGDTEATFSWAGMGSGGGLSNSADLESNEGLRPLQIGSMNDGFGWIVDANSSAEASLAVNVDLSAYAGGSAELTFAAGSQNGSVTLVVSAGNELTNISLSPGADSLQTVDISSLAGSNAVISFSFSDFTGTDNAVIDNIQVVAEAVETGGGSLFILDNAASVELVQDWYDTPMGTLFVGSEPWIWSIEYGWHYSDPNNSTSSAFVYIQDEPFATWVFVDQDSATAQGFWGFAFDAANPALNGWFWFFNEASTNNNGSFFIWDGQQTLTFDDKSN
jgi:hypothetical protein